MGRIRLLGEGRRTGLFRLVGVGVTTGLLALGAVWPGETVVAQSASGPLRVHATNRRYFANAAGQPVYLTGSHTWLNLQDGVLTDPPPAFNYTQYLDFLQAHQHNFFRLWHWEQARWAVEESPSFYFTPHPYQRTGPGNALDGKPKFDLTAFNQAYFDRMRQRIIQARDRGIYVSIMLFNGWSISYPKGGEAASNPWRGHPYNGNNNINGINGDPNNDNSGDEIHTLAVPAVTARQEAYVRKVIDTVNDLDNVLYEISNESNGDATAWQYHMINVIKSYQAGKPKQHPVGMTVEWPNGDNADLFASAADWISPNQYADPPPATGNKVIISDTDHIWGIGGDRVWVWKSFTRGMNPIFMDQYDDSYRLNGGGYDMNNANDVSLRRNMGYTRQYATRMNLAAMTPSTSLASTGYCLANATAVGAEYLVYLPNGGSTSVNLSATTRTMAVEWFNPATGQATPGTPVAGGATRSFSAPFGGDAVLYLYDSGATSPPTISSVSPSSGPTTGGQAVTILGANLSGATSVTFGGTAAAITGSSATSISVTTPARAAGVVSVDVTTAGGTATAAGAYTYVAPPTIAGVDPPNGPTAGGQEVTISGTNLNGTTSVTFGGTAATITGKTATTVTALTPARAAGAVNVVVTATGGSVTAAGAYTYLAPPTISGVSPSSGPVAGGQSVTITGTNLTGALSVAFGGTAATITGNTATSVTVTSPPGAAGASNVTVTTGGGSATAAGAYTYLTTPSIAGVSPSSGPTAGGQSVTISGANLSGATSVTFGGTVASITGNTASSITVTTPAGAAGSVTVAVTAAAGTTSAAGAYTYVAAPTITSVSPSTGPTSGGQSVNITGTNMSGASSVTFGGTAAAITGNTATIVTVTTPARPAGAVNVVVTTPSGSATSANGYTYGASPTLSSVSPSSGPTEGGQTVVVNGANLSGATSVTFGGVAAAIVGNTSSSVTVVTPPRAAGTVTVSVSTSVGTASASGAYTYLAPPTISGVSPSSGSTAGGQNVVISGSSLGGAIDVTFGGTPGTIVGNTASSVTVTAPPRAAGTVSVVVSTASGQATAANAYIYLATPSITSVSPNKGPSAGGQTVTIAGTSLAGATSVRFGGAVATITAVTATSVTVVTPISGSGGGPVDVTVVTPGGTAVANKAYSYQNGSPSRPKGVRVRSEE